MKNENEKKWSTIIRPKTQLIDINLYEIWEYKDLVMIFVRRDIVSMNKQTVLGPLWFFLGPLFTVFTYVLVFSEIANISTDNIPAPLFYLGGTILWNYFSACFNGTSSTFLTNASIFGKVYFPRLVVPISLIISNLIKFFIQLLLFLLFWSYYYLNGLIKPNSLILSLPLLILLMGGIALGIGILISALTTKYRDLTYFISFGITLLMYATPVIYPMDSIPNKFRWLLEINPIAPIIETFRFGFTGSGSFSYISLLYSFIFMVIILFFFFFFFNKTEKTFMDTV
ncbi:MAG: ABC transporter permease [Flavobacteriia bacterium]|nr:ABC transporter permease [Flavobacteriia bacterium]